MEALVLWYIGWMLTEGLFEKWPNILGHDAPPWYQIMLQWPVWLGRIIAFNLRRRDE